MTPAPHQPCSGPNCWSAPSSSPLVPAPALERESQWAVVLTAPALGDATPGGSLEGPGSPHSRRFGPPPDPPPRSYSALRS